MAGEVEASGQPLSRRNEEHGPTLRRILAELIDGRLKNSSIRRRSVSYSSEIRQRRGVSAAAYGAVVEVVVAAEVTAVECI